MTESTISPLDPSEEMNKEEAHAAGENKTHENTEEEFLSQGQGDRFDRWVEFFSAMK